MTSRTVLVPKRGSVSTPGGVTLLTPRRGALSVAGGSGTETSTGSLAFGPVAIAAVAADLTISTTGSLAFGPIAIAALGSRHPNVAGDLAFGPVEFLGVGAGAHPSSGKLAFGPVGFTAYSGVEQSAGGLAFGPVAMGGVVHVPPLATATLAFGPVLIFAGGGAKVTELDVGVVAAPPVHAQIAELDVAVVCPPGAVHAQVSELDVAVVATPAVTTASGVAELDVAVLAYIGPCATSRCQVWKITRRDGVIFGFTSLDTNVTWRGQLYKTCKSLTTTAASSTSELKSAGDVELTGILDDASISDEDLYAGLFDDAYVEVWVIPYDGQPDDQAPFKQAGGWLGKVTRGEFNFTAEVIGPGGKMAQAGVVDFVTPGCRWDFGVLDANGIGCPVNAASFQVTNIAVTGSVLRSLVNFVHPDPGGVAQWDNGKLIWQTGRNAGVVCQVETVDWSGALSLWDLAPYPPAIGDLFTLQPGCPKTKPACQAYGVYISFGGFEDIPGPDALQSNADSLFT